jgi:glycosyltransferase involved in cell wall biosynthesis
MRITQAVTLVSADGAFGGPLAVAIAQCRELAARGHEVTLLAAWDGKLELQIPGVRVILSRGRRIPGTGFSGVRAPSLTKWLREHSNDIDVLHVHAGRHAFDLEIAVTARRVHLPYVLQTHGMVMPSRRPFARVLDRVVTRPVLREAASVLTLTDTEAGGVRSVEPLATVRSVHNGLELSERPSRENHKVPEVLFLARLHPRKRASAFAEMARILTERGIEATFSIVGPDEGDLDDIETFIQDNPTVPLSYEGPITPGSGASRIARSDIYVLPSRGEVFPISVLEALSASTPVVLTSDCGIADRLAQADAASITDGTPEGLALGVTELLLDADLRSRRASAGRKLIEGDLGVTSMVDGVQAAYRAAVTDSNRPKIVWVTNQAAPYRIPVWNALANDFDLEVWLLESDRSLQQDQNNRGDDWTVAGRTFDFKVRTLPTISIRRGEARHYINGWLGLRPLRGVHAVLIGGWDSPAYWVLSYLARSAGVRLVGFYESHVLSQQSRRGFLASARRHFFKSLDAVVVPGAASRDTLLAEGIQHDKLYVGFNAVDVRAIHRDTATARTIVSGKQEQGLRLLVVGQLISRKNVGEVIRSLTEVGLRDATLTVVGSGPLEHELRTLSRDLRVENRVRFTGYLPGDALPSVFAEHDVLVHPALEEVWGLVVNEALAAGLRVIVSNRAGVAPSIKHMEGVFITTPEAEGIAAQARLINNKAPIRNPAILSHDPESFARIFRNALVEYRSSESASRASTGNLPTHTDIEETAS